MFPSARQIFPVIVAALILCSQLAISPIVGLADNGDYVNVTGPLQLVPATPVTGAERYFGFVIPVWQHSPAERVIVRLFTSTLLPTAAVYYLTGPFTDGLLGLRLVGLAHSALLLAALWLIVPIIRSPAVWIAILAVLCDVAYFSYFNSFYMDVGSFLFLMLSAAFYARIAASYGNLRWNMGGLMIAVLLFLTSKLQHTFLIAPLLCLFLFDKRIREAVSIKGMVAYALLLCAAVWGMYQRVPQDYRAMAAYHIVFSDLLLNTQDQEAVLTELGLPREMTTFRGTDAFGAESGMNHPNYRSVLLQHLSHAKLLGYYLRHPEAPMRLTLAALKDGAYERHFGHGNFTSSAGKQPGETSHAFAIVSDTRRALFENRPLLYAFYLLAVAGGLIYATRGALPSLVLVAMAGLEFFLSALADCKETGRHLFLFRALMDLALAALIYQIARRRQTAA
ncbi:MAG: hypothetical protein JST93_26865 [Acidobacteria bacterium]|nr:hypothetical protein [Acidobacteriota bacterium]